MPLHRVDHGQICHFALSVTTGGPKGPSDHRTQPRGVCSAPVVVSQPRSPGPKIAKGGHLFMRARYWAMGSSGSVRPCRIEQQCSQDDRWRATTRQAIWRQIFPYRCIKPVIDDSVLASGNGMCEEDRAHEHARRAGQLQR